MNQNIGSASKTHICPFLLSGWSWNEPRRLPPLKKKSSCHSNKENTFEIYSLYKHSLHPLIHLSLLDAFSHLYKRICPSVGPSVHPSVCPSVRRTVVWKSQGQRCKYWATCLSIRSFARTAHSFACSTLLVSLARSAALIHSLACSPVGHSVQFLRIVPYRLKLNKRASIT